MLLISFLLLLSTSQILSESLSDELSISIGQVPWQASVQINDKHHCGGAIYSPNIILTIAQCVRQADVDIISVRVGSSLKSSGGQLVKVKKVRMQLLGLRPSDVAILKLSSPLELGSEVQAIELSQELPSPGTNATVSGWAQPNALVPSSEILLKVNLQIQDQLKCTAEKILKGRVINVDELCAAPSGVIPLACEGFVGGPLVSNKKLVGLVSYNNACGFLNSPSVYANIPILQGWIKTTVQLLQIF
ncbi:trypsin alpha [Drosophila rhopaloa]|uniref:trypsin n=1 Tax=Drosophila rhopaloa TaxID=1041015 RepID=A0A6P4DZF8_DRORH|nr:trypsin alpha [Drosophila rhopaloa]